MVACAAGKRWRGIDKATDPAYQQIIAASGDFSEASDTQSLRSTDVRTHRDNLPLCSAHGNKEKL